MGEVKKAAEAKRHGSIFLESGHYHRTGLNQSARRPDEVTRLTADVPEIIAIDGSSPNFKSFRSKRELEE
jgi:hypothetical protein